MLPDITGEFGVVAEPEIRFSESGKAWAKVRGVAKDRKRDSNGEWVDGDPIFIDILIFGKPAEHIVESVNKGDTIIVKGRLTPNNWTDKEGNERKEVKIMADEIGVSVRWNPAKAPSMLLESGAAVATATLGGTPVQSEDAPF
jgi:single-strand DNA-binding protein